MNNFLRSILLMLLSMFLSQAIAESAAVGLLASDHYSKQIKHENKTGSNTIFVSSDALTGSIQFDIDVNDVNTSRPLFLVAKLNGDWFMYDNAGQWQSWQGQLKDLQAFTSRILQSQETIDLPLGQTQNEGQYAFYAGYLNSKNQIVYNKNPLTFTVFDETKSGLRQFSSPAMLEQFLKDGLKTQANQNRIYPEVFNIEIVSTDSLSSTTKTTDFSTTNIQEMGVEEGDRIKTDGQHLYVLGSCDAQQDNIEALPIDFVSDSCITTFKLSENTANAEKISQITLDNKYFFRKLYLSNRQTTEQTEWLIAISQSNQLNPIWYDLWGWQSQKTAVQWFNADDATALTESHQVQLDGNLVSTRRVNRVLYVATRFTPWIKDFKTYPLDEEERVFNDQLLQTASLQDLMPTISYDQETFAQLVAAKNCYLPPLAQEIVPDPSIITVTAISLDNPQDTRSVCIVGASETLYMSPESIYLATTKYPYPRFLVDQQRDTLTDEPVFDPEHKTEIHKFSIEDIDVAYKGSGEVIGHLGWHEDKKPFRMSEYNGALRIATSVGNNWGEQLTSSTNLSILKENEDAAQLEIVGRLEGLGKPGEQLYASRFIGSRGYLVTFRLTDPLYILDLSNPASPAVLGELEIEGYSDYLHPIGENYLLGIGKDAIADTQSTDRLGRGAWYQGVKLSLFDISDPAQPSEVNSIVLGKRGTDSDVLYDHHALAYLPPNDLRGARLAIPVRLHEDTPPENFFDLSQPSAWYDYTHTGLYLFNIDTSANPGIFEHGKMIAEQDDSGFGFNFLRSDRAVLQGDSVHYIHGDDVISADWRDF